MSGTEDRGRFDGLVELAGAFAPAAAAGFAAFSLAPVLALSPASASLSAGSAMFALAFGAMRLVAPEPRQHQLAPFRVEPIEALPEFLPEYLSDGSFEEPMLLDVPYEEPHEVLILDDVLIEPEENSRVVRLFGNQPVPTPGQLKDRIDRHLAGGSPQRHVPHQPALPDATDALFAALADLRRSLR